jgi:hypothetical protein
MGEKREAEPMNEHHSKREDNGYVRKGTCSVFMFGEALGGRRYVSASRQRTQKDQSREVKAIVSEEYPQVVLVMDNLNTHTISSIYETFPAREAFETAQKPEIHYTPKQGRWLNIAGIELSALALSVSGPTDRHAGKAVG